MYSDLKNKVAVVTGGLKGIGQAIAKRFGEEHMSVVINYRSDKTGADEAVKLIEENGGQAVAVQADISEEDGATALL